MFPFDSVFYHLVLFAFNCLIFKELCRPLSPALSCDSFYILPRRWLSVNTFFQFIFKFVFLWWPSCWRLCYLITFTPFLSTPFFLFLRLFSSFLSLHSFSSCHSCQRLPSGSILVLFWFVISFDTILLPYFKIANYSLFNCSICEKLKKKSVAFFRFLCYSNKVLSHLCGCGGIGIRARLRGVWGNSYGFKSR